jgi:hypothetical protein
MNYYLPISNILEKNRKITEKAQSFNHDILYSEYAEQLATLSPEELEAGKPIKRFQSSRKACLVVFCNKHPDQGDQETTVAKYLNARCGLSCCGYQRVGEKLTNRVFSPETLKRMAAARKAVVQRNPPRTDKRIEHVRLVEWRNSVYREGQYKCAVSGVKPARLNAHHLYSKKAFLSLKYIPENGIPLDVLIHQHFHNTVGSLNIVTIDHFLDFLEKLKKDKNFRIETFQKVVPRKKCQTYEQLISNKISFFNNDFSEEKDKCSETSNFYNIENICELFERMTELKTYLLSKMTDEEKELAILAYENPILARGFTTITSEEES